MKSKENMVFNWSGGKDSAFCLNKVLKDQRYEIMCLLTTLNLTGVFPLWKIPTDKLIREFIDSGFKSITTCVNDKYLDKSFVGKIIDDDFLKNLPEGIDPCGENGEYHSFVFDAPFFSKLIQFEKGEIVHRKYAPTAQEEQSTVDSNVKDHKDSPFDNGFWYCDLLPT